MVMDTQNLLLVEMYFLPDFLNTKQICDFQ